VTLPLLRTRYDGQEAASSNSAVIFSIRYGETPIVTTVSLQRKFYSCSGPPKSEAPQNHQFTLAHATTLL
ncbi:hypothetical protein HAX54_043733, partial [Datura stramonium]|nr:hypothetical protein [Datura stramonium]